MTALAEEHADCKGLTSTGDTRSGVDLFGDEYPGGLIGRGGDNAPMGDMPIGDIGAREGGGTDAIADISCVDKLHKMYKNNVQNRIRIRKN
jgi:hypothetical protein